MQIVGELPADKEGRHNVKRTLRREKKQEASGGRGEKEAADIWPEQREGKQRNGR